MAERASISRTTLNKVEQGDPGVSVGTYATVLFVLGLCDGLAQLADIRSDPEGIDLEEEHLPQRIRRPGTTRRPDPDRQRSRVERYGQGSAGVRDSPRGDTPEQFTAATTWKNDDPAAGSAPSSSVEVPVSPSRKQPRSEASARVPRYTS